MSFYLKHVDIKTYYQVKQRFQEQRFSIRKFHIVFITDEETDTYSDRQQESRDAVIFEPILRAVVATIMRISEEGLSLLENSVIISARSRSLVLHVKRVIAATVAFRAWSIFCNMLYNSIWICRTLFLELTNMMVFGKHTSKGRVPSCCFSASFNRKRKPSCRGVGSLRNINVAFGRSTEHRITPSVRSQSQYRENPPSLIIASSVAESAGAVHVNKTASGGRHGWMRPMLVNSDRNSDYWRMQCASSTYNRPIWDWNRICNSSDRNSGEFNCSGLRRIFVYSKLASLLYIVRSAIFESP